MEKDLIENRVAKSPLITLDLGELIPEGERVFLDLKEQLWQGQILREKDFREFIASHDWSKYSDKHVAVGCTEDAIIPQWAYMMVANKLAAHAVTVVEGDLEQLERYLLQRAIDRINPEAYQDKKIVVKGCGEKEIPASAFLEISLKLTPYVSSLMYGEPCSTVPVYKRPRKRS